MIVGLTGGIGSGKTTVLKLFKELGAKIYIADLEAKRLMNSNEKLICQIKKLLGEEAYDNGQLNRAYISSVVFNDKEKLSELNKIVHPKVREDFKKFSDSHKKEIVIYESAILFESESDKFCGFIITVIADFEDKIERIMKRDGISKKQILERMKHQLNDESKILKSDFVIKNSDLAATKTQVSTIYSILNKLYN